MFYEDNDLISLFNVRDNDKILESLNMGLNKGSAFKADYKPYKNYQVYGITVTNEKEALLLKIYELAFFINDLNLYLDLHNDDVVLNKFKEYTNTFNALVDDYEKLYGPLCVTSANYKNFKWRDNWPWDKEGDLYV